MHHHSCDLTASVDNFMLIVSVQHGAYIPSVQNVPAVSESGKSGHGPLGSAVLHTESCGLKLVLKQKSIFFASKSNRCAA